MWRMDWLICLVAGCEYGLGYDTIRIWIWLWVNVIAVGSDISREDIYGRRLAL